MFRRLSDPPSAEHGKGKREKPARPLRFYAGFYQKDIELTKAPDLELKANPSQEMVLRRRSTMGVLEEEVTRQKQRQEFYIRQINLRLRQVPSFPRFVPLDPYTQTLGRACQDGVLLW